MSFLQIKSANPNLSYLLQKNPKAGIIIKQFREGLMFGYYTNDYYDQEYNIYFKDGDDEVSIKTHPDEMVEYLNLTRYNSAIFISNAIKEFLGHIENNKYSDVDKDVKDYQHDITINMVYVGIPKYLEFFKNSFPEINLQWNQVIGHNYKIKMTSFGTLHELVNYASLLSLFLIMINKDEYIFIDESIVERYIKIMNRLNANYYIRYLFKLRIIDDKISYFNKYKAELENVVGSSVKMELGDTHVQRISFVESKLTFKNPIVDLGCGEGRHSIPLSKKASEIHAIDIDPEVRVELGHKIRKKKIENIKVYESLEDYLLSNSDNKVDVVCSEVIEHMNLDEVCDFLDGAFKINANRIIITTPNADFNTNYSLIGFRHNDHKFEFSSEEFELFMNKYISSRDLKNFNYEFFGVGDSVDGNHVSQAIVLTKI